MPLDLPSFVFWSFLKLQLIKFKFTTDKRYKFCNLVGDRILKDYVSDITKGIHSGHDGEKRTNAGNKKMTNTIKSLQGFMVIWIY